MKLFEILNMPYLDYSDNLIGIWMSNNLSDYALQTCLTGPITC